MSGPIVRTGTTPAFWNNWDSVFGGQTASKKAAPAKAAAPKAAKKSVAKKSAAKKAATKKKK